jgi:hypothetical protein
LYGDPINAIAISDHDPDRFQTLREMAVGVSLWQLRKFYMLMHVNSHD